MEPLAPRARKNKKGGRARHGLRAPCQRVRIEFGAGGGTRERLRRALFAYSPIWLKGRGVYPNMTIPHFFNYDGSARAEPGRAFFYNCGGSARAAAYPLEIRWAGRSP